MARGFPVRPIRAQYCSQCRYSSRLPCALSASVPKTPGYSAYPSLKFCRASFESDPADRARRPWRLQYAANHCAGTGVWSPRSIAYAISAGRVFRWLIQQRYALANRFAGVKGRGAQRQPAWMPRGRSRRASGCYWAPCRWTRMAPRGTAPAAHLRFLLDFGYAIVLRAGHHMSLAAVVQSLNACGGELQQDARHPTRHEALLPLAARLRGTVVWGAGVLPVPPVRCPPRTASVPTASCTQRRGASPQSLRRCAGPAPSWTAMAPQGIDPRRGAALLVREVGQRLSTSRASNSVVTRRVWVFYDLRGRRSRWHR